MSKKWFALNAEQIEKKLKTNAATGLSRKAARSRYNKEAGSLFYSQKKSLAKMLMELFSDFTLIILLLVAVVALFFDAFSMGIVILSLVVLNLAFSLFIYHRCHRTTESLDSFFRPTAKVIRESKLFSVEYSQVVPGDVILLDEGDTLGCDSRLIRSDSLVVLMQVDKEQTCIVEKNAEGVTAANEIHAVNMVNMVHAGSTVLSGSARAIVTDVGKYTYLGALTGGVEKKIASDVPSELLSIKKFFSRISMALLIAILPICIIGLLMSNIRGGRVFLSDAFLLSVTFAASLMAQKACTVFNYFYVHFLRRSVVNQNPAVVRSIPSLDKLSKVDYIFLLDGAVLTDGIYHYSEKIDSSFKTKNESNNLYLAELVSIYRNVERHAISAGVSETEVYYKGIDDYLSKNPIDLEKIKIRFSVMSYSSIKEDGEKCESISFTDKGQKMYLKVHRTPYIISKCCFSTENGQDISLHKEELYDIERECINKMLLGDKLLVFTVQKGEHECFVGALCFKEGSDTNLVRSIQALEKNYTKVIIFAESDTEQQLPKVPEKFYRAPCVKAEDFLDKNLPVTYRFGSFSTYYGMNASQISELVSYVHKQNKTVAVVGFSDFASAAIDTADLFITSAPITSTLGGHLDEEIKSLEVSGVPTSVSCKQTVKDKAEVLISRPFNGRGGLLTLLRSIGFVKFAKQNVAGFFRFSMTMLILRLIVAVIPLLLGNLILDARHLLFFMTFFDIPVFLMYASNNNLRFSQRSPALFELSIKEYIKRELPLLISMMIGGILLFTLPYIPDAFGLYYFYNVEYHFAAITWLQIAVLYYLCYERIDCVREAIKNKMLLIAVGIVVALVILMFLIDPLGRLLGIERNPIVYLTLSFVPAIAFLASNAMLQKRMTK